MDIVVLPKKSNVFRPVGRIAEYLHWSKLRVEGTQVIGMTRGPWYTLRPDELFNILDHRLLQTAADQVHGGERSDAGSGAMNCNVYGHLAIVNLDQVRQVRPHTNGECFLVLDSGTEVKVSRSYRDVVARFVH